MYGSYGSYSSMSAVSAPMDISPGYNSAHVHAPGGSCAFPSWPRRPSLSEPYRPHGGGGDDDYDCGRATSFLSDEDLFPSDPVEDDAHSVFSNSSAASPVSSNGSSPSVDPLELERERLAYQRQMMRFLLAEKERRRQQMRRSQQQRQADAAAGKKGSPRTKPSAMAPIAE